MEFRHPFLVPQKSAFQRHLAAFLIWLAGGGDGEGGDEIGGGSAS